MYVLSPSHCARSPAGLYAYYSSGCVHSLFGCVHCSPVSCVHSVRMCLLSIRLYVVFTLRLCVLSVRMCVLSTPLYALSTPRYVLSTPLYALSIRPCVLFTLRLYALSIRLCMHVAHVVGEPVIRPGPARQSLVVEELVSSASACATLKPYMYVRTSNRQTMETFVVSRCRCTEMFILLFHHRASPTRVTSRLRIEIQSSWLLREGLHRFSPLFYNYHFCPA
eukprot:scpid32523/ scgid25727/ 